jgi:hypothetical protein
VLESVTITTTLALPGRARASDLTMNLTIRCDPGTGTLLLNSTSVHALRAARTINVLLPDGRREELRRAPWSVSGMTSKRYSNARLVLKVTDDPHMSRREACILRALRGAAVPSVLCSEGQVLLMENVGEPVTAANLPMDYREQTVDILASLRRSRIEHGDIWKGFDPSASRVGTPWRTQRWARSPDSLHAQRHTPAQGYKPTAHLVAHALRVPLLVPSLGFP